MADSNPANFANLSKERVQEIAAMGGKASHGTNGNANGDTNAEELDKVGRNPDGTFKPNSEAASEAGKKGGHCSHENDGKEENEDNGRDAEGKFLPGSAAAKEAGHTGGLHVHGKETEGEKNEKGRDEEGQFIAGSEAAKEAGHKGGLAAAANN